jgi:hypothetical protein
MHTLSPDTHPKVEQLHIELLRNAPVWKRLQMVNSMVKATWRLSWQGICERYPDESLGARIERFMLLLYNDKVIAKKIADSFREKDITGK